jgi:hypothetical protein
MLSKLSDVCVTVCGARGDCVEGQAQGEGCKMMMIQGTFGGIQGTFGGIQGTFGGIQGTFGGIQGTFGGIRGTFGEIR